MEKKDTMLLNRFERRSVKLLCAREACAWLWGHAWAIDFDETVDEKCVYHHYMEKSKLDETSFGAEIYRNDLPCRLDQLIWKRECWAAALKAFLLFSSFKLCCCCFFSVDVIDRITQKRGHIRLKHNEPPNSSEMFTIFSPSLTVFSVPMFLLPFFIFDVHSIFD